MEAELFPWRRGDGRRHLQRVGEHRERAVDADADDDEDSGRDAPRDNPALLGGAKEAHRVEGRGDAVVRCRRCANPWKPTTSWLMQAGQLAREMLELTCSLAVPGKTTDEILEEYASGASMRKLISPQDVADMAVFLASDKASLVSGQVIAVDGHTENPEPRS